MNKIRGLLSLLLLWSLVVSAAPIRVACVGNSITYGYGLADPGKDSYPSQLQLLLGKDYEVGNFGHSGATLLRHGHRPYFDLPEFHDALSFKADIAVIHLGVNDTDPRDWPEYGREFATDYMALIDSLRAVNPDMRIIIANLSPLKATHFRFRSGTRLWRLKIREEIERIAEYADAELIDFDTPLRDRQDLLYDGIHPDAKGYRLLAESVYSAISGDYGGLKLPEVYQSGMVLQRNCPLLIQGTANAGSRISLSLNNVSYRVTADNQGQWSVTTAPLATGGPYSLKVSDGKEEILLSDILAGEVWIAAGQSNMEFHLDWSVGGKDAIEKCADPLLRIYDKRPIAVTNQAAWSTEIIDKVDSVQYYLPASWQPIGKENAGVFSAVAYYFANVLRESMPDVPIGIISMAIGGATLESWIDVNTLEEGMPEILLNWTGNDYVQKWAQGRAIENVGKGHRHPYEPSYLFSAGVRDLEGLPVAGVIWYQGESNAHNTDIFEQLYPMFIDSWRDNFNNPQLPIYAVQLSSIERPSWPEFRDAQRRLTDSIPFTAMAVSSDWGDRKDVHPTNKRPIGERLARQALHNIYGFSDIIPQGPTPVSVKAVDGNIEIEMEWGEGLTTSDGQEPRTFEIAEIDGFYQPASAKFSDNKIIVNNMNIKNPRYVRYGWQPFSEANVINSDSLPMSTFKAEIDNIGDFSMEDGLEFGVSAPFAAPLGGNIVMAGGCNFPTMNPFAPDAVKKYYEGIYMCDPQLMQWQRVGSLPQPMAYGATAMLDDNNIVLIGGLTEQGPINDVNLLSIDNNKVSLKPLPSLPEPLDNMAAIAIGDKVYVVGGNVNGTPSAELYMLDLSQSPSDWKKLKKMPGNPRVQPVMTKGKDSENEECLFVFGGFAPRFNGKEPTLELDGLKYSPSKNKWSVVKGPKDLTNQPVSLGGGCTAISESGNAAFAGGVNKDVFLSALTNQAPDYLQHPIEWYKFNPIVFSYDTAKDEWTILGDTPDAARAGAAMVALGNNYYIIGGELKPRVRSAEILEIPLTE